MRSFLARMRGIAPNELVPAAQDLATTATRSVAKRSVRRLVTGQTKAVEQIAGPEFASTFFFATPLGEPTWFEVRRRFEVLYRQDPTVAADFVVKALRETHDPCSIIGLGRHPLAIDTVRTWIQRSLPTTDKKEIRRLRSQPLVGGAIAGVAAQLLSAAEATAIDHWLIEQYPIPDRRHFEVRDSVGYSPVDGAIREARPVKRRLVIAYTPDDLDQLELLFAGAESGTLVVLTDTFGKAAFGGDGEPADWLPPITIEHVRSRVTRFSQEYVDLHEGTRKIGRAIAEQVAETFTPLDRESLRFLYASVADFLFFQSLKIVAIDHLLSDPSFDDIIVAVDNHLGQEEYTRLLAGIPQLFVDERVSIASVSRSARYRQRFWSVIDTLLAPNFEPYRAGKEVPIGAIERFVTTTAAQLAKDLGRVRRSKLPPVIVVTKNSPAYNEATAQYLNQLSDNFSATVLFVGRNATDLTVALDQVGGRGRRVPIRFLSIGPTELSPIARTVQSLIKLDLIEAADYTDEVVLWAAKAGFARMSIDALARPLLESQVVTAWFSQLAADSPVPRAVIVTPNRSPDVAMATTSARRLGIPSVALEPHAQDSNYSRYAKVAADYYGLISNYHRERAPKSFDIDIDRVATIGSPRLSIGPGSDAAELHFAARQHARRRIGLAAGGDEIVLVFFGQPSKWEHVAKVWFNILQAAKATAATVLLKPHPEESPSRIDEYVRLASDAGTTDRFGLIDDFDSAIEVADIGLTAYSTAAVDAVIRGLPMVVMTDGDVDYPIDMGALIGAPTLRSADQLVDLIERYRNDPTTLTDLVAGFIDREPELARGNGDKLVRFISDIITAGEGGVRSWDSVPEEVLFAAPHPTFEV